MVVLVAVRRVWVMLGGFTPFCLVDFGGFASFLCGGCRIPTLTSNVVGFGLSGAFWFPAVWRSLGVGVIQTPVDAFKTSLWLVM